MPQCQPSDQLIFILSSTAKPDFSILVERLKTQRPIRVRGVYWKQHLRKHGADEVETLWYCLYLDLDSLQNFAMTFSIQNNIVESKEWANLIIETGLDNGSTSGLGNGTFGKKILSRKKLSVEAKENLSAQMKKFWRRRGTVRLSLDQRARISATLKQKYSSGELVNPMTGKKGVNNPNFGSKRTEEFKQQQSARFAGEHNGMFGKTHSEETKQLWIDRGRNKGENNANFGKIGALNHNYGKPRRAEDIKKWADKLRGRPQRQVTCPHCGKTGGITVMKRWHFSKCKFNPMELPRQ